MNEFKSFFKTVGGGEGDKCHYPTRLDTYGKGCQHDCDYCMDGETNILMYDGSLKKLKDISIGDVIYGVERHGYFRNFTKSIVTAKWTTEKQSYKITLANGTELICSGDHRFLSNRGWKYVVGTMHGDGQRPFLTTKNNLRGFDTPMIEPQITDEYRRGYLYGMINGDGHLATHICNRANGQQGTLHQFRLALKEEAGVKRTAEFLEYFGVKPSWFDFPMKDRQTQEIIPRRAIRTASKKEYDAICGLVQNPEESKEWKRGFLAGFYDAEGCKHNGAKRVSNLDKAFIGLYTDALETFGFSYALDKRQRDGLISVRLIGGQSEVMKFLLLCQPAIKVNFSFEGIHLKSERSKNLKIASIELHQENHLLYDITTTTGNFIANGIVSHNCYAKSLLSFRNMWNAEEPAVADIAKIEKVVKRLPAGSVVRLGGMTDCFMPMEKQVRNTYKTIELLNKHGVGYLIVTKSALVAAREYVELMDPNLAHIQVTVTSTSDELYRNQRYEKASLPSQRVEAILELQRKGFDVAVRLSPLVEELIDFGYLNGLGINKAVVEFLRVNHWIKKWFDIDYSKYTLKEGGYQHLPLEEKTRVLAKIKIPSVTVCEDYTEHYGYWKDNYNPNPKDCCNLRLPEGCEKGNVAGPGEKTPKMNKKP